MSITDGYELVSPDFYGQNGPPHEIWRQLREQSPVHRCDNKDIHPFWAITKHEDIGTISKQPDLFESYPGIMLVPANQEINREQGVGAMRTLIEMDPPRHRQFRKIASPSFTPRSLSKLDPEIEKSARELVDHLAGNGEERECDYSSDVAAAHPLRILSTALGISRDHEPEILRVTNQLFALDDDELGRPGEDRQAAAMGLGLELFNLLNPIIEDRKKNPRDDLASVLANGLVDGEPMTQLETLGYYLITFTAGHDTTKNALAGGMAALMDHPDQLELLQKNPDLIPSAVEEIIRWTSPVNFMRRTAARDTELRGQTIKAGDHLGLFYGSANRDADVFEDPFRFDISRDPNRHVGFGVGEHFCLGAHLARRSQQALLKELVSRLEWVEPNGEREWIKASFVIGFKHMPIRYRIRPSA
ncbi:MAG: cytochrome P450 [Myxococcota bacterium]|nr:cytochrome P450 [Myxococcota bacterium]